MAKKSPNPLQKFVRGVIRDLINEANSQKTNKPNKLKTNKSNKTKPQTKRSRYKCVFCGRNSNQIQLEVDHIIPFSKGGSNNLSNLQTLCIDCNRGKGARNLK